MLTISLLKILQNKLPILTWSVKYDLNKAISDLIAGITVGLTLIPQSIAYASLAGLEPQYGLYASLCGGIIYTVFGTIPELNNGPTALISLLTFSYTHNLSFGNVYGVILLCFLSGVIELLCGILRLGFLLDFVSLPVVSAFTSAGAITIGSSQVKNLLGIKITATNFLNLWENIFKHISETKLWDCLMGLTCCLVLLSLRKLKDFGSPPVNKNNDNEKNNKFKICLWFISVARNAFVVIFCAVLAFIFLKYNEMPFALTSKVPAGWPKIEPPPFSVAKNGTTINFIQLVKELGSGIIVVPFVSILGNVAIAKAFAHGKVVDASQEMIALGICNLIGSFFSSYPVSASFSRSAVGNASGVKTPLAGLYTGIMVILALTFLTPYFSYIPKATLAAVIICAVCFMVEIRIIKTLWNLNKYDLIPFTITLLASLAFGIEIGILTGICIDIIRLLYNSARPKILIEKTKTEKGISYYKITPTSSVLFASAEFLRQNVLKTLENSVSIVLIDFSRIATMDFTGLKCVESLLEDLKKRKYFTILYNVDEEIEEKLNKMSVNRKKTVKIVKTMEDLNFYLENKENGFIEPPVISITPL